MANDNKGNQQQGQNRGNPQQGQQQGQQSNGNSQVEAKLAELNALIEQTKKLNEELSSKVASVPVTGSASSELEEMRKLHAEMVKMAAQKELAGDKKTESGVVLAAEQPHFKDVIIVPLPKVFNGNPPAGAKQIRIGVQIPHGARRIVQLWMLPGMEAEVTNIATKAYFKEMGIWSCDHMPETWVEPMPKDADKPVVSGTVSTAEVSDTVLEASNNLKAELAGMV